MDKSRLIMCRAASSLTEMKRSLLDEPTAKRLHELITKDDMKIEEEEELVENENMSGFGANPEFIKILNCGKIKVKLLALPPLGQGIDGIALPRLPPIKTLEGQIGNCSTPFEKQLTTTDLAKSQCRLSFCKMAVDELLKPMLKEWEDLILGIDVTVYDENGRGFAMCFKYWSDKYNVLMMGWKTFCLEKEFRACEDWLTIWMFRRKDTNELCFAIVPRRFPITNLIGKAKKTGSNGIVKNNKGKGKGKGKNMRCSPESK